ncbi:MAG: YHS domain protein [Cyclobacteriaceae bacterium]|nr:YHS domain protein [Cyclobacteriaceae bacterium]
MTRISLLALLLLVSVSTVAQQESGRQQQYNLKKGIALQGYDPVSYFLNKPEEGKETYSFTQRGVTYWFASASRREEFKRNPDKYEPAYGGWCAYAMGESGEKVKVDPETYKIVDGKLYLFYNFWGNNTLETWNKNEANLKRNAELHWKKFEPR